MYFNRFTQGAKAAIDLGKNCAKSLGHRVVGTEHLVVGLLREKDGIAARVLKNLGMDVNTFENKLIEIKGSDSHDASLQFYKDMDFFMIDSKEFEKIIH